MNAQSAKSQAAKLSPEIVASIVATISTRPELSYKEIGKMFGLTEYRVWEIATQNGVARLKKTRRLSAELRASILAALKESHSALSTDRSPIQTIAHKFNVTTSQVLNLSIKAGLSFRRKYRSFEAAREWARASGIRSCEDWSKMPIPRDIPANPHDVYLRKGWISWPDFLGNATWTPRTVLAYLEEIRPLLPSLSDADLLKLLKNRGLLAKFRLDGGGIAEILRVLRSGEPPVFGEKDDGFIDEGVRESDYESPETEIDPHTPDRVKSLDTSPEVIEHIIESQLTALRAKWFRDGQAPTMLVPSPAETGGEFVREISRRFLEEVSGVQSLDTPWWGLHKDGAVVPPSPMQKYVAWKLQREKVFGNWSGTGAGKTASAGLAAYAITSELTVVLTANSTVAGWREQLEQTFPKCRVYTRPSEVQRGTGAFLILNYEKFQTTNARRTAKTIIAIRPDFVVLDEVQLVKRRDGKSSHRSVVIGEMLLQLPEVRVLGMSATPVINELREGISLLETLKRQKSLLKTRVNIPNALELFAALRQIGIRYLPYYGQKEETVKLSVQRDELLAELQTTSDILQIEQILLPAKLEAIKNRIKPGTVIYLEYVQGMVETVRAFVETIGYTVGEYIGDVASEDREGAKKQFIAGEIDVLIGSRAISVGVDGLQHRCDQLVILSLPWTHAAYTQLVGRVYRQGGTGRVQVVIPQVIVGSDGGRWSWDEARLKHIDSKRTLAECATDGVIPTTSTLTREALAAKAIQALNKLTKKAKASAF